MLADRMFIIVALCLGISFTPLVTALRPKDAYTEDAKLNASAADLLELQQVEALAPVDIKPWNYEHCKAAATLVKARSWAKASEWEDLKDLIMPLHDEGVYWGKWQAIGDALLELEGIAGEITTMLEAIETAEDDDDGHSLQTQKAFDFARKYINPFSIGVVAGKLVGPIYTIVGEDLPQTAVDKAYAKNKYAKHFKEFWDAKIAALPKGRAKTRLEERAPTSPNYGDGVTPESLMNQVIAPIKELYWDLCKGKDDCTKLVKLLVELCLKDDNPYKVTWMQYLVERQSDDPFDEDPVVERITDFTHGKYMHDIKQGCDQISNCPARTTAPDNGWTAGTR
mmetsp:Transcript_57285/g.136172  ORF Transcript_57285/g.136172 Transcript_57285/m.136172 type:complete len:339 (+) Transcript_57285:181-1197(+)|eukprot:CAMPEP_0178444314 /NCGR_PEP_ID=MMETSP0689_2-20121128/39423_1 /TAXON_ID=160604 /ORGANISM="Amphidinium massartii, Strain CS-259" /LENGTH=338 /DNA_ID=CAMNT_0020068501 /DNA_START=89 /DNA_END=1105 /DNA_ORIENTATION=+